jgi:hypothetical protein
MRITWSANPIFTAVAAAACVVACEETLLVRDKERLTPENTSTDLLVAGAIRDFKVGYSGAVIGRFVVVSALLTDELYSTGTGTFATATDQRAQFPLGDGNSAAGTYNLLHRARRAAIRAFRALEDDGDGNTPDASLMKMYEGFTYIALGEGFCSGIPFSEVAPDGELIHGVPISTNQVFEEAITRFDHAISIDGSNYAAAIGKGRALANLGRHVEAAAAVASVPTTYTKQILHSDNSTDQTNAVWSLQDNGRYGFGVTPDGSDVVRNLKDPRMLYLDGGPGFDEGIKLYLFLLMSERDSPVMLADGIEARLIEAEADLVAGGTAWLGILNDLRAGVDDLMAGKYPNYASILAMATEAGNVEPLGLLNDPGVMKERVKLLLDERLAWMAMTGHRLGDLRRLLREDPYRGMFTADEIFPSGRYFKAGDYGTDVNLAMDFDEQNNPSWNTSMCSYTTP